MLRPSRVKIEQTEQIPNDPPGWGGGEVLLLAIIPVPQLNLTVCRRYLQGCAQAILPVVDNTAFLKDNNNIKQSPFFSA